MARVDSGSSEVPTLEFMWSNIKVTYWSVHSMSIQELDLGISRRRS